MQLTFQKIHLLRFIALLTGFSDLKTLNLFSGVQKEEETSPNN